MTAPGTVLPVALDPRDAGPAHIRVLDGLRGIAVLLVVLYHYWLHSGFWKPVESLEFLQFNGMFGVELFFFISAFCLFFPHAKAMAGLGPPPTLRHYAGRRAIKILPSYLLCLLVCGTVLGAISPAAGPADWALHLTFLHNLRPETTGSFNGVFWSLAVEVQFYVVFPLLARAARRFPLLTVTGMVGVALGYRAWARTWPIPVLPRWDNMLPGYLDLFALGMLAAYLVVLIRRRAAAAQRMAPAFTVLALAATTALLIMFRWVFELRFEPGLPVVWQSCNRQYLAVLLLCVTVPSVYALEVWQRILANRVLVFLSTISYNLYLWHLVIGLAIKQHGWLPVGTADPTHDPRWQVTYVVVGVAASVGVATAITYALERPLLRLGVRGSIRALRASVGRRHRSRPLLS